jgi:hypothetical protein
MCHLTANRPCSTHLMQIQSKQNNYLYYVAYQFILKSYLMFFISRFKAPIIKAVVSLGTIVTPRLAINSSRNSIHNSFKFIACFVQYI